MRRIFRVAMIGVAAAGVVCYLAVSYALHHPGSVLAQCTLAALQLANDHPLARAAGSIGRTAYRIAGSAGSSAELTPEEEEQLLCVPPEPLPIEEAAPLEKQEACQEQSNFILQTIKQELPHTDLKPAAHTETSVVDREGDFPATMPHCLDMEEESEEMPSAADSKPASSTDPLFKFWLDLFESAAQESDAEPRYFHDEEPPRCLEDPAYENQYPGCPYTGKCPYEGRSGTPKIADPTPAVPPTSKSVPKLGAKRKADKQMTDPKKYELPARLRQLVPGDSTEAQEEPSHPEVDTTEFRPSDAKPGEFDPKPM